MLTPQKNQSEIYTYADYLNWDEDERIEIIEGEPVMKACPSSQHQQISIAIASQLYNFLENKKCRVFTAPFSVRLFEGLEEKEEEKDRPENIKTVVEPDILVICDKNKIDKKGCKGAPDMIIEILSPSTARNDRFVKLHLYRRAGVKEYWIVDPAEESVQAYWFQNGEIFPTAFYGKNDNAKVNVLENCFINFSKVFI